MCGRYTLTENEPGRLGDRFAFDPALLAEPPHPRYNAAPAQSVLAVIAGPNGSRRPVYLLRGLIPPWSKDGKPGPVNAVSQTAAVKPMFRPAIRRQRAVILADGFYEWKAVPRSQPDGALPLHPGRWPPVCPRRGLGARAGARGRDRFLRHPLTTRPNELVAEVHDRMPVILRPDLEALWIDPAVTDPAVLVPAFEPLPAAEMAAYVASTRANAVRNDDAEWIRPVPGPLTWSR
jgi:putative SOS response-associated peptidase YedK